MYIHGIHTHIYIHVKHEVGFPFKPMQEALGPNTGNIYENLKKSLCSYFFMRIHKNFSGRPGSKCGKLTYRKVGISASCSDYIAFRDCALF